MNWLASPYYKPVPDLRGDVKVVAVNGWGQQSTALGVEGSLQAEITSSLSGVSSWLDPSYYNPRSANKTLDGFVADFMGDIMFRLRYYPSLGAGIDPVSLAVQYGKIFVDTLKQISAADAGGGAGVSVWDAWVAMP